MYDVIAGTFLVVGLGEEDFVSLSPELAQKYEEECHQPEAFLPLGRRLMVCLLYTSERVSAFAKLKPIVWMQERLQLCYCPM